MADLLIDGKKNVTILGDSERTRRPLWWMLRESEDTAEHLHHGCVAERLVKIDDFLWLICLRERRNWKLLPYMRPDGFALVFDVASRESFGYVTKEAYVQAWRYHASVCKGELEEGQLGKERFGCILVGLNMYDLDREPREVESVTASNWAESQCIKYFEIAFAKDNATGRQRTEEPLMALWRSMMWAEQRNAEDFEEQPKPPVNTFEQILGRMRTTALHEYRRTSQPLPVVDGLYNATYRELQSAYQYLSGAVAGEREKGT